MPRAESSPREPQSSLRALALGLRAGRVVVAASIVFGAYVWWRAPRRPVRALDLSNCNAVWSDEEPLRPRCPDVDREYRESLRQEEIPFDEARSLLAGVPSENLFGVGHTVEGVWLHSYGGHATFTIGPVEFTGTSSGSGRGTAYSVVAEQFDFQCGIGAWPEVGDDGRVWRSDRLGVYAFECAPRRSPSPTETPNQRRVWRLGVRATPAPVVMPSDVASRSEPRARWWRAFWIFVMGASCWLGALAAGFGRWGTAALGLALLRWQRGEYDGSESIEIEGGGQVAAPTEARRVVAIGETNGNVARGVVYVVCDTASTQHAEPYRSKREAATLLVTEADFGRWRSGLVRRVSWMGALGVAAVAATWAALRVWLS